jgi:histone deacetylase 1/2
LDVWGHTQTSVSGHNYYVSFIDAYSRFTWLYLIKRKSDVFDVFLQFQAHVERLLKTKIIIVQSDWGGEYQNLNSFFPETWDFAPGVLSSYTSTKRCC